MELSEILKNFGFNENVVIESQSNDTTIEKEEHVWTINDNYILKVYKSETEFNNALLMANILEKGNIKTQRLVKTLKNEDYIKYQDRYYILFKKIKGYVLNDYFLQGFEERSIKIGRDLGELHIGLKEITQEVKENKEIFDNNLIEELKDWVKVELDKYIDNSDLDYYEISEFKEAKKELEENFYETYNTLPRQVIHRDFHLGNIIFNEDNIAGFIDFDLSQINARIFDLCYMLTGSLSTVFDKLEMRESWISFAKNLIRGYEEVNKLEKIEVKSIKYIMYSIEMIMIAYFAQNGYKEIANTNIRMVNYLRELEGVF